MQETRRQILEALRYGGALTVDDLTARLHLTRTAVRAHLAALRAEGLVSHHGLRRGRHRPSVVYALTPAADHLFPKAYEEFALALLEELRREGNGLLGRVLRRIGDRWIAQDLPRVQELRGRARVERVLDILTERGFMPTLVPSPGGLLLREHNCPLMRLAVADAEVCQMVHRWLEALCGVPVSRTQCMRSGDPWSAYALTGIEDPGQEPGQANGSGPHPGGGPSPQRAGPP